MKNGAHREFRLTIEGQPTGIKTHTSHNSQELDDFLIKSMARQIRLQAADFIRLVECSLGGKEYAEMMIAGGHFVPKGEAPEKAASTPKSRSSKPKKRSKS